MAEAAHPDGLFLEQLDGRAPAGVEVVPDLGREVRLVPVLPAPGLLVSPWDGVVVSRPGALRRLAVHAARTGGTVAVAASSRLPQRVQHWSCPPSQVRTKAIASST